MHMWGTMCQLDQAIGFLLSACLRAVAPLFFAYNHNKYEELCITAIIDALTLPSNIEQNFWLVVGHSGGSRGVS